MPATYPVPVFHFQVKWGGDRIGFSDVSGLNFTRDVIEYRDGSSPEYHPEKITGMEKFGNITLKRGIFEGDNQLFQWFSAVNLSKPDRRTLTIDLLNEEHEPILTYTLIDAFPCKFDGVAFKSTGTELAIESVEVCVRSWSVAMS